MYRTFTPPDKNLLADLTKQQLELREKIRIQPLQNDIKLIAGCDSSFNGDTILSVFVLLTFPELEIVEKVWHHAPVTVPYIPGFLAFREAPNLLKAFAKLSQTPDLIMVDGHGIAHPRRIGIACHVGLHTGIPSFGVAKNVLAGKYEEPAELKGAVTPLIHKHEHIGNVLRTKDWVKPVFVSAGHLCDLETATHITLQTARKHKLPEPTRLADHYAAVFKLDVNKEPGLF